MIHVHITPYWLVQFVCFCWRKWLTKMGRSCTKSLNQSLIRNGRNLSARHDHGEYSWPMLYIQCWLEHRLWKVKRKGEWNTKNVNLIFNFYNQSNSKKNAIYEPWVNLRDATFIRDNEKQFTANDVTLFQLDHFNLRCCLLK